MENSVHPARGCAALLESARLNLSYLAEGAANVIYRAVPQDDAHKMHANCCVMRMRKDLGFTKPCIEAMHDFETQIAPLFQSMPEVLMQQHLYKLTPDDVKVVNELLHIMESSSLPPGAKARAGSRRGAYHPSFEDEPHGILMPNLNQTGGLRLIEFKAKWLVQSPSAPEGSIRCRTCALNAARRSSGKSQGRGDSGFCPLDLLSKDEKILTQALAAIWTDASSLGNFTRSFQQKVQPALYHLQELENRFDAVGLEDFRRPEGKDFSVAMALRDCSIFLSVSSDPDNEQEQGRIKDMKFADLDLKSTDGGKLEKWASMEESLLAEGWYMDEKGVPNFCALGRSIQP